MIPIHFILYLIFFALSRGMRKKAEPQRGKCGGSAKSPNAAADSRDAGASQRRGKAIKKTPVPRLIPLCRETRRGSAGKPEPQTICRAAALRHYGEGSEGGRGRRDEACGEGTGTICRATCRAICRADSLPLSPRSPASPTTDDRRPGAIRSPQVRRSPLKARSCPRCAGTG